MRAALAPALIFCLWAAAAFVVRCHNLHDVFIGGRIYFTDGDCYSRMTRVRLIEEHPWTAIRHQDFENYPIGTTTHTTVPMDYLILATKGCSTALLHALDPARTSLLEGQTLDVGGALVSPLLGAIACGFIALFARSLSFGRAWGWAAPLLWCASPIVVHGTLLGRPDHQSLQMALLAVALVAELRLAERASRGWAIAAGLSWGLALWVSLYEPAILFGAVLALWLWLRPRALIACERWPEWITLICIGGIALAIEGWPVELPDPAMRDALARWGGTIGELGRISPFSPLLFKWLGSGWITFPVLLGLACREDRRALPAGMLLALTTVLTCWQIRWGYFMALVYVLTLPWQLAALWRGWGWLWEWVAARVRAPRFVRIVLDIAAIGCAAVLALWPLIAEWDLRLHPDSTQQTNAHTELMLLRETAESLRGPERAGFLAPWWISPPLAYWSGQPGVAGSSHEAIAGIVDSARFYLAVKPAEAADILKRRKVSRVIADDPDRVIAKCAPILGEPATGLRMSNVLFERPREPTAYLVPTFSNAYFKVFAVDEARLKP